MSKTKLYPDFHNLFTELRNGKPLAYTPLQIAEEFEAYIADLENNPICVEVEYRSHKKSGTGDDVGREEKNGQVRTEKYPASPTISDFVGRWLGKSMRYWNELKNVKDAKKREQYESVKNLISVYCRKVKLNGAEVGIYNYNIVARELGLVDKQAVETTGRSIQYVVTSQEDADKLQKAAKGAGLVE